MKKRFWGVITLVLVAQIAPKARAESNTETAGDIFQVIIPASAFGATFFVDDEQGRGEFYKSFFTNLGVTYALKYAINNRSR